MDHGQEKWYEEAQSRDHFDSNVQKTTFNKLKIKGMAKEKTIMKMTSRGNQVRIPYLLLLWAACWVSWVSGAHHHRAIRGEQLRGRPAMKIRASTVIEWDQSDDSKSATDKQTPKKHRQLYTDHSRIGAIGTDAEDPFFESDAADNNDLHHHRLASPNAPSTPVGNMNGSSSYVWNGTAMVDRSMNWTIGGVIAMGEVDLESTKSLTETGPNPPSIAPLIGPDDGTVVLSAAEEAQLAGTTIISSAQESLAAGRKGKMSGKNSAKATAGGKSRTGGSVKGAKGAKGSSSLSATAFSGDSKSAKVKGSAKKSSLQATAFSSASQKSKMKSTAGAQSMSAFGVFGASGGKGGKGGGMMSFSNSATTLVSASSLNPEEENVTTPPVPAPTSTTVVSSSFEAAPTPVIAAATGSDSDYPPTRGGALEADCNAIRQGKADKNTPGMEAFTIQADWILAEGADFETVAADVKQYLQTKVAPPIAGCDERRRRRGRRRQLTRRSLQFISTQSIVSNVLFESPSRDGEGLCSTSSPNSCHATQTVAEIYYHGVDSGIGMRLLAFLQAAGNFDVNDLLAVKNLVVLDSDSNPVGGSNLPTGAGNSGGSGGSGSNAGTTFESNAAAVAAEQPEVEEGVTPWTKTILVVGVSAASAFFGTILFYIVCRRCRERRDFQSMPRPDEGEQMPDKIGSKTWLNDDDAESTDDEGFSNMALKGSIATAAKTAKEKEAEVHMNCHGDTHICASSYCEVCSLSGPPQIQFVSSAATDPYNELPEDATRTYYAEDTVRL
ncbi:expressed unknown protein [Seminavis robusta]|uniref:Transmembrane protein n=1 Tax=Seminavis robusta TaxID=568900 RepID=A0A9N8H292_9STRA|nr:expressed unknown protein [Seminavis robusta]|eukprot:Sro31_g020560.1 n/a (780) ;mRNA; f:158794-161221